MDVTLVRESWRVELERNFECPGWQNMTLDEFSDKYMVPAFRQMDADLYAFFSAPCQRNWGNPESMRAR